MRIRDVVDRLRSRRPLPVVAAPATRLFGSGEFAQEIVGEAMYQRQLERIAGPKTAAGVRLRCLARLTFEDENRHDPNAVVVTIAGQTVGYLARADAEEFRRALDELSPGATRAECDALVHGGWRRPGGEVRYGVRLDLE